MIDSEFERKGREMATTWDNLLETNDALMRRIAELERERDQLRAELEQVKRDACELANLALMIGDVTDAGDLELVNKYTGRN